MSIYLTSTSDKVQVITGSAGAIDVHATWADLAGSAVTVDRKNTKIATAATTDVIVAPLASTARSVKGINVQNIHASVSNLITVQHTDGTNIVQLEQVTLAPGERIAYSEGGTHVYDAQGRIKVPALGLPTGNANTGDVLANAADTYLQGGSLLIGGRVQAASYFKWRMRATKTGAGTVAPIFNVRVGTTGTITDAVRATVTAAVQTAIADTAFFEMDGVFRAVGATAVIQLTLRFDHLLATTGFANTQFQMLANLGGTFDATSLANIIGVSVNPGTLGVWTFQEVIIEAGNLLS